MLIRRWEDRKIMALPDLVWRILLQKGVQDRYETWLSDAMPKPKKEFLFPVFDQETWDHMMQAIKEALEIWKKQVIEEAMKPEPGRMFKWSEWDRMTPEF